jgi:hypothetical protein
MKKCIEVRAADALKALLQQVSAVKVRDITIESPAHGRRKEILARIDVYGRHHILFCKVKPKGQPRNVQMALDELHADAPHFEEETTPVLIAPQLSVEARELCRKKRLSFLDLEGNAHLEVNDIFFGKRCLPRQMAVPQ